MFYTTVDEGTGAPGQTLHNPTGLWWPGRKVRRELDVSNIGSLQVRLHQVSADITSINGLEPGHADYDGDLEASFADSMNVKIYVSDHPTKVLYDGLLAALLSDPQATLSTGRLSQAI